MRLVLPITTVRGPVTIIHDAVAADVEAYPISDGLCSIIRNPALRRRFYLDLATSADARLTLALAGGVIVGRAVIAHSFGRWQRLPRVREFAIEIAREWRHTGLTSQLVRAALGDPAVEHEIVVAFTLPSAWDAEYERLPLPMYGRKLVEGAAEHGFQQVSTDEPEVRQRDAAMLVRYGASVPAEVLAAFERARYLRPFAAAA